MFIICDNAPQFESICEKYNHEIKQHEPERLVAPSQLNGYAKDQYDVWDVRLLSLEMLKRGVEPFVME